MDKLQENEQEVLAAVRRFARTITSTKPVVADMSELVEVTNRIPLRNIDFWERKIRNEFASELGEFNYWRDTKRSRPLTWLDLISWDGYKREKVLRTISGKVPNAFFFLMLFRRLNDWAPVVREAASIKVLELARKSDPDDMVEALLVVLSYWNSWGRISDSEKQVILNVVRLDKIAEKLKVKLINSANGSMTNLLTQLARASIVDDDLVEIAKHAIQPSVRAKAYRFLFEDRVYWIEGRKFEWTDKRYCLGRYVPIVAERKLCEYPYKINLIKYGKDDRSAAVRRVAAEFLISMLTSLEIEEVRNIAEQFSTDKSKSVAERGLFILRQMVET